MTATSPLGQVLREDGRLRLEFVRTYDEPVEQVWAALTDPERTARWFGRWSGDPASGSVQLVMTAEDDQTPQEVRVLECAPPTRLALEVPSPDGTWPLSATLREVEGGTELTFVHAMAEPYDASGIGPGWQYYLDRLGAVVTGDPVPEDFGAYHPALEGAYPLPG